MYHALSNFFGTFTPFTSSLNIKQCSGEFEILAGLPVVACTLTTPWSFSSIDANILMHFSFMYLSPCKICVYLLEIFVTS